MRILIEGYHYQAADVKDVLQGLDFLENVSHEVVVNYVGYLYNPHIGDCVFILPKVLIDKEDKEDKEGRVFGHISPKEIIHLEAAKDKLKPEELHFIYEFAVWIYRALYVYKNKNPQSEIIYYKQMAQIGQQRRHITNTFLEVLLALIDFNKRNQDFFMTIVKNQHSGYNKINWTRTISRQTAIVQNGEPIYLRPINKKRQINFDEELLVIFFSILRHINQTYGFPVNINLGFELITGGKFQHYIEGYGRTRLRQIKYKYFSDRALYLWELCYAFFERSHNVSVASELQEYLIAKDFNIVFESIIDELIGDPQSALPSNLKDQRDGKRVDHLYRDEALTTFGEQNDSVKKIFYIGDSKYYKFESPIGDESVYKQYTYARNLIQWNIDLFLNDEAKDKDWKNLTPEYRDDTTEGYNIVPNFFISARMDKNLSYADDISQHDEDKRYYMSEHFKNRLFDRDTLLIYHFDVNFLYVVSLYARDNSSAKAAWKTKVRGIFRREIQNILNKDFSFYTMTARPNVDAKAYIRTHFQDVLGKIFQPYKDEQNYFSLALDNKYKTENDEIIKKLRNYFYIADCKLGSDPRPAIEKVVSEDKQGIVPMKSDLVLCIMFDKVDKEIAKVGMVERIAQGLSTKESALQITGDISQTRYVLLHNKRECYLYRCTKAPRLVYKSDVGKAIIKLKGVELYILFEVSPTPINVEIDKKKLAVAKGDDRISYYSTLIEFSKLIANDTPKT